MRTSICNGNSKSIKLVTWEGTFPELADLFSNPIVGEKDGPYFIRGEAQVRNDASLKFAELIIIDCDASIDPSTGKTILKNASNYTGCPDLKLITAPLKDAEFEFVVYSTYSHTVTVNKCRVAIHFISNNPEELRNAVDYVIDLIRSYGVLLADANENYVWSQPWFAARIATTNSPFYHHYNSGKLLDKTEIDAFIAERAASLTKPADKILPITQTAKPTSQTLPPSELDQLNGLVTLDDYATLLTNHNYTYSHETEFNNANSHHYIRPGSISGKPGVHVYSHETSSSLCYKTHHGEDDKLHLTEDGFGFYADAINCLDHEGKLTYSEKLKLMQELFRNTACASIIEQGIKDVSTDIGAVFEDEFVDALNLLRDSSVSDYMRTLQKIQVANKEITKTDLEKACKKRAVKEESSLTTSLIEMLEDKVDVFHDNELTGYAEIKVGNHSEIMPIDHKDFGYYIHKTYFDETAQTLKSAIIDDAKDLLNSRAIIQYEERPVARRCAKVDDEFIIDIGNNDWQVIEVTSTGWKVLAKSPIAFIRSKTMLSLPIPDKKNADVSLLLRNTNLPETDFPLVLAFLIETFRTDTANPVLLASGGEGTCKSSSAETLKNITDPSTANLRTPPKRTEEFVIACANSHVVAYDNLSNITQELHDMMCVASTGASYSTRELYTNAGENVIHLNTPIIITGITDLINRPDLAQRTIIIRLKPVSLSKRKEDNELEKQFKKDAPKIMGGLLNLFSETLAKLPTTNIAEKPRMASYAKLGVAMTKTPTFQKLGIECDFLQLFAANQQSSTNDTIESSSVAVLLLQLMPTLKDNKYSGTFKGLYGNLSLIKGNMHGFPKSYVALSNELRRLEPSLITTGITVKRDEKPKQDGKHVHISYVPTENENNISENDVNHRQQKNDDDEHHIATLIADDIKNDLISRNISSSGIDPSHSNSSELNIMRLVPDEYKSSFPTPNPFDKK